MDQSPEPAPPPTIDYVRPGIAAVRPPPRVLLRIAFFCWLLPLAFGSAVFFAEMVNRRYETPDRGNGSTMSPPNAADERRELLEQAGVYTIEAGTILAVVAVVCLIAFVNIRSETHDREREVRRPVRRMLLLLASNFVVAILMTCAGV